MLGDLSDGYGYGFDYGKPAGVKLIHPDLHRLLRANGDSDKLSTDNLEIRSAIDKLSLNPSRTNNSPRLTVWLHLVHGCNFACHYCYIPHLRRAVSREEIEQHSFQRKNIAPLLSNLLAYCRAEGLPELRIMFAGGEPTLNLPLVDTFCSDAQAHSQDVRITFGMISNGSFDFDELIPLLHRHNISISLSLDGYQNSHDQIRFEIVNQKKVGSWNKITGNVEQLLKEGIRPFFLFTITPGNYSHIHEFASFAHDQRLGFRLSLVKSVTAPSMEVQSDIADTLIHLYRNLAETLDPKLPILKYAAMAEWFLYRKKHVPCASCKSYFAISNSGDVCACQMRMDHTYGSGLSEEFSSALSRIRSDPTNAALSNSLARNGACTRCQYFHVCAGGCPHHNLLATGNMDHPSPWCSVYGRLVPEYIRSIARQLHRVFASEGQ